MVAGKPKFTRIPKVDTLIQSGVPAEVIPTYCALADHANNKTGLCWPKMETLAHILNRSVRTVQRHLHLLRDRGLIEFVNRRRYKGRFGSYLYRVLHIQTTGHPRQVGRQGPNIRRTKQRRTTPKSPVDAGNLATVLAEGDVPELHRRVEQWMDWSEAKLNEYEVIYFGHRDSGTTQ
jgi:DNA-binding transcriptional ArsR family regulator